MLLTVRQIRQLGFPVRFPFLQFLGRYSVLARRAARNPNMDPALLCEKTLRAANLSPREYRIGHSKVFLREPQVSYSILFASVFLRECV